MRHLIEYGHDVHVVTGAPDFVFTSEIQSPNLHIRKVKLKQAFLCRIVHFSVDNVIMIEALVTGCVGLWSCAS